jgi:tetratricopeptide (TPR) repeat protein
VDARNGVKISRIDGLMALLKDPNNKEFKDQVYYQVAQLQVADKDIEGAIKNYKLSIRYSVKNQNQKGLSYLRLAEIDFKNKADYLNAKKYYDSTLTTLSVNYPGYKSIQKLSENLNLLADRLQIISREDTLQALAKMDEKTRDALIDKMVNDRILQQQAIANAAANNAGSYDPGPQSGQTGGNSSFYFYNSTAVSQGFSDFKRKWGNRKLEDNWRRSDRSASDITNNTANSIQASDPDAPIGQARTGKTANTAANYRQELMKGLPLTPALVSQSNQRIYNAYVDIGNFYRDILGDKKEAVAIYELILRRFPNDPNKPAIYYNLYRLYSDLDPAKSDLYKNRLLKDYPETPFAKIISDPDFAKKLDDKDAAFNEVYNKVFDLYANKKYKDVIAAVPALLKQYPDNKFAAQLFYLQTIAEGHAEGVGPFRDSLQQILKKFPNDRLIAPLINQHLAYISANQPELLTRKVVLADDDPHEVPFTLTPALQEETEYRRPVKPGDFVQTPAVKLPDSKQPTTATPTVQTPNITAASQPAVKHADSVKTTATVPPATIQADNKPSIFSMRDSTNYYFVVNVNSSTTNLSSSRFGIGQFNRANYQGNGIRHQLLAIGPDNQLIFVGRFLTLNGVKKYANAIIPLMPDIMKVPKDKYTFFIITKENLDKLADKNTLDSYLDYYQKNY